VAQATCGDKNGAAVGTSPVTDADCGSGFLYQASKSGGLCAGPVCDASTTDQAVCCVVAAAFSGMLTDAQFKVATWDWVQNTTNATIIWGDIGSWDVTQVKDFDYAFSKDRNEAGTAEQIRGNELVKDFTGAGVDKWKTNSVTSMKYTFRHATKMTADLKGWSVAQVTSLLQTFRDCSGVRGLGSWDTTSVTSMDRTFNENHGFTGLGLDKWNTAQAWGVKVCPVGVRLRRPTGVMQEPYLYTLVRALPPPPPPPPSPDFPACPRMSPHAPPPPACV
jgi:surface protein